MSSFKAKFPAGVTVGLPFKKDGEVVGQVTAVEATDDPAMVLVTVRVNDRELYDELMNPKPASGFLDEDEQITADEAERLYKERGGELYRGHVRPSPLNIFEALLDTRDYQTLKAEAFKDLKFETEDQALAFMGGFYTGNDLAKTRLRPVHLRTQGKERRRFKRQLLDAIRFKVKAEYPEAAAAVEKVVKDFVEDPPVE